MTTFEEIGSRIDREMEKLREFLAKELKPATERKAIAALRGASKRLAALAEELEARARKKAG